MHFLLILETFLQQSPTAHPAFIPIHIIRNPPKYLNFIVFFTLLHGLDTEKKVSFFHVLFHPTNSKGNWLLIRFVLFRGSKESFAAAAAATK